MSQSRSTKYTRAVLATGLAVTLAGAAPALASVPGPGGAALAYSLAYSDAVLPGEGRPPSPGPTNPDSPS